ncbi:unnamed protein product, partial [marine sediment metagenome]
MKMKKIEIGLMISIIVVVSLSLVYAATSSTGFSTSSSGARFGSSVTPTFTGSTSGYQFARPGGFNSIYSGDELRTYWPILRDMENDQCEATSDFIISIPPGGCEPAV